MNFRNVSLKIAVCLLILCLGFILGSWSRTARHQIDNSHWNYPECNQIDDFHQFVYLYDTEQKIEDYYRDKLELHPENSSARSTIEFMRQRERPVAGVGPFIVFASNDNRTFSVARRCDLPQLQSSYLRLVTLSNSETLRSREPIKLLSFASLIEKDWSMPRFGASLTYSEDGVYKSGRFFVIGKDGRVSRTYLDNTGTGAFDTMWASENGEMFEYSLNDLTWELQRKLPPPQGPGLMPPPGNPSIP